MDHHRYLALSGISDRLIYGIMYIQALYTLTFNVYAGDPDHISVTVRAAVLLSASGCVSMFPEDICQLPFRSRSFLSAVQSFLLSPAVDAAGTIGTVCISIMAFRDILW